MLKNKILLKISGSIATYKVADLISKLMQNNFEVQTVVTDNALQFIGKATLEGLTGKPVYTDSFEEGKMMSHINLMNWADLILLAPATGNTINKMACGIADNLVTSLFLVWDKKKPYLIAPAMNTNMYEHPTTQDSLKKLSSWGVKVLPTGDGWLACGAVGKGKLLEVQEIMNYIKNTLENKSKERLEVIITSGGTIENIDNVRYITNLSTGKTAAAIADYFIEREHKVTFLHSINSALPSGKCKNIQFTSFNDLNSNLSKFLKEKIYDAFIHPAAVSDFSIKSVIINNEEIKTPISKKINSDADEIILKLKKNHKIVDKLKGLSKNKKIKLVAFKLTTLKDEKEKYAEVEKLFSNSKADYIVQNDLSSRKGNVQENYFIYANNNLKIKIKNARELAIALENLLTNQEMNK
ncbi:MAG: bifunctional phosphopantothenoylcysteine decarboxylase/phosphopantothenate--cysteine ligase CoaBC [Ignavibacteriales bacterium]|nr:bifunctional phosphopantothenoylcysteine decarboxylase/phosphopantothenate--cysteine ligase CoaBC [Ignavibacteriales bacterium]